MTNKVRKHIINTIEPPYYYNLQPYGLTIEEVKSIMEELFYNEQKNIKVNIVISDTTDNGGFIQVVHQTGDLSTERSICNEYYYEEFPECGWLRNDFFANGYKVFSWDSSDNFLEPEETDE